MHSLWCRRILILEGEFFLAEELERMLGVEDALVVGPCAALAQAERLPWPRSTVPFLPTTSETAQLRLRREAAHARSHSLRRDHAWVLKAYEARVLIAALRRVMGVAEQ